MEITSAIVSESHSINNPPLFFRQAAVRATQRSLAQVQTCGEILSAQIRIQALHILDYALHLDNHWPLARELLLLLADKLEQSGYREGWLAFLEHGLRLSQQYKDRTATAELHLRIGYLFQLHGKPDAACHHYAASTSGFAQSGQLDRRARVLNRYAFTTWQQQKLPQALQLVNEARQLVADTHPEQANALLVRGWIFFSNNDWSESFACFAQSAAILQTNGTRYQLACALRDLGAPLQRLTRYAEAIECYHQALALFDQLDNRFQQAVVRMNLGIIYFSCQQMTAALELFAQAEPIFRQLHDQEHLGKLYLNQALVYRALDNFPISERLLRASIALFEQLGNLDWWANTVDELGVTLLHMGERQQAIVTFQAALAILDNAPHECAEELRTTIVSHLRHSCH